MNKRKQNKINKQIRYTEVRIVGDGNSQVMKTSEALYMAESQGKDLIVINDMQCPPIAIIEDYNKFLYQKEKKAKEIKKKSDKSVTKEIKLSAEIGENDLLTKARKGNEFLESGNKIKCTLQLKGRQRNSPERGELTMLRYIELLEENGIPEAVPKFQGGRWTVNIKPKKS